MLLYINDLRCMGHLNPNGDTKEYALEMYDYVVSRNLKKGLRYTELITQVCYDLDVLGMEFFPKQETIFIEKVTKDLWQNTNPSQ